MADLDDNKQRTQEQNALFNNYGTMQPPTPQVMNDPTPTVTAHGARCRCCHCTSEEKKMLIGGGAGTVLGSTAGAVVASCAARGGTAAVLGMPASGFGALVGGVVCLVGNLSIFSCYKCRKGPEVRGYSSGYSP